MKFRLFKDKRFYESYQNHYLRDDLRAKPAISRQILFLSGVAHLGYFYGYAAGREILLN